MPIFDGVQNGGKANGRRERGMTRVSRAPLLRFGAVLLTPETAIASIAADPPSGARAFFGAALWLGLFPPVFAYIGTTAFGWRLGVDPLFLPASRILAIAAAYFVLLLVGFLSTAVVAHWMGRTYGAATSWSRSFALVTLVGAPLTVGSVAHLYPNAFLNVLVLVPTLI